MIAGKLVFPSSPLRPLPRGAHWTPPRWLGMRDFLTYATCTVALQCYADIRRL
jgi:hypothetical protein